MSFATCNLRVEYVINVNAFEPNHTLIKPLSLISHWRWSIAQTQRSSRWNEVEYFHWTISMEVWSVLYNKVNAKVSLLHLHKEQINRTSSSRDIVEWSYSSFLRRSFCFWATNIFTYICRRREYTVDRMHARLLTLFICYLHTVYVIRFLWDQARCYRYSFSFLFAYRSNEQCNV